MKYLVIVGWVFSLPFFAFGEGLENMDLPAIYGSGHSIKATLKRDKNVLLNSSKAPLFYENANNKVEKTFGDIYLLDNVYGFQCSLIYDKEHSAKIVSSGRSIVLNIEPVIHIENNNRRATQVELRSHGDKSIDALVVPMMQGNITFAGLKESACGEWFDFEIIPFSADSFDEAALDQEEQNVAL